MELHEAIDLIKPALKPPQPGKVWADLGAGKGLFSRALATILGKNSTVYAVDRSTQELEHSFNGNRIVFHQLDFSKDRLPFSDLDGVLMANSLHFVKDKVLLLSNLRKHLRHNGQLLVIEYELRKGNAWVPFPVPYVTLEAQLAESGFKNISIIGERQSIYAGRKIYVCAAVNGH